MIRFRNSEDERRYVTLRTEMFAALAQAGLPPDRIAMVMRNVGKVETMLHLEGVRQGLAMAAIAEAADNGDPSKPTALPDPYSFKAYQLHALIYGSSDTPLRAVEKEWLGRLGLDADHEATAWLDDKPMRFAPMTLEEWLEQQSAKPPVYKIRSPYKPRPAADSATADGGMALAWDGSAIDPSTSPSGHVDFELPADETGVGELDPLTAADRELLRQLEAAPDDAGDDWRLDGQQRKDPDKEARLDNALREIASSDRDPIEIMRERGLLDDDARSATTAPAPEDPHAPENPDFLDTVRSELLVLMKGGFKPTTWQELIFSLHVHMKVDAAYLDLQLSTHVGRAVLDQVGLPGIAPGSAISLAELLGDPSTAPTPRDPVGGF